ncbi:MAG: hypothetical protein ACHQ4H_03105 [Ktedonobacterales bacterium]
MAVRGGIVYGADPHAAYALRARDGAILWHYVFPDGQWWGAATLVGDTLYVATQHGGQEAAALPAASSRCARRMVCSCGTTILISGANAPIVLDGTLYTAEFGSMDAEGNAMSDIVVLRAGGGVVIWRYPLGMNGGLLAVGAEMLYLCGRDNQVTTLRLSDRHVRWRSAGCCHCGRGSARASARALAG